MSETIQGIEPLLDRNDVCRVLGVSQRTLDRILANEANRIKLGAKKPHGHWRFMRGHVHDYARSYLNR